MDKWHIRKEIAALINSIKEHSDSIGDKEHIPQLELELILLKIEKLYQRSIVFNHLHSESTSRKSEFSKTVSPAADLPKTEVKKEIPKPEPVKQEPPVDLFGSELVPPVEKPKVEKKTETPIVKQQAKEEKRETATPVTNIHKPSISDIRSAIGLNDKFLFANELFEGNIQEYEIAIQQLNTAETIESASEYFMSIQQLYNWPNDNETVKRLFDLVERRYS